MQLTLSHHDWDLAWPNPNACRKLYIRSLSYVWSVHDLFGINTNANIESIFGTVSNSLNIFFLKTDYGLYDAIGDTDFYPNGGNDQPGCGALSDPRKDANHLNSFRKLIYFLFI